MLPKAQREIPKLESGIAVAFSPGMTVLRKIRTEKRLLRKQGAWWLLCLLGLVCLVETVLLTLVVIRGWGSY